MNRWKPEPGRVTAVVLAGVLLAVEAVIVAESWRGLTGFAHLIGITGPAAWGVPVTLDGVSLVAALVALRGAVRGGLGPVPGGAVRVHRRERGR